MSLQAVQSQTTSTEFVEWMRYLEDDVNAFHREDWYAAQIAAEVRRFTSKEPERVATRDMILKFTAKEKDKPALDPAVRMKMSKAFWFAIAGASPPKE